MAVATPFVNEYTRVHSADLTETLTFFENPEVDTDPGFFCPADEDIEGDAERVALVKTFYEERAGWLLIAKANHIPGHHTYSRLYWSPQRGCVNAQDGADGTCFIWNAARDANHVAELWREYMLTPVSEAGNGFIEWLMERKGGSFIEYESVPLGDDPYVGCP